MRFMDAIELAIEDVRKAAEANGLAALARESGVPYTTVKSFADRDWGHKNLDVVRQLAAASRRLLSRGTAS